jgi:hypothetical protein
LFIGGQPIF